jgi:hypothetical protein
MTTDLQGNGFYFTDGTTLTSAYIPWSNISGRPTNLSQLTYNVSNPYATGNCGGSTSFGNCGNVGYGTYWIYTYQSGPTLYALPGYQNCYNCNCNCNCNC